MDGSNPVAGMGHNNPPAFDAEVHNTFLEKSKEWLSGAQAWLKKGDIKTEEEAQLCADYKAGIVTNRKMADAQRAAEKKVHDAAGKAVQAAYKPVLDSMDMAIDRVTPLLTKWMQAKEAARLADVARQEEEARKAQAEADAKAAEAAESGDLAAELEAKAALEAASEKAKATARAAKQKTRVESASGGGRTVSMRSYNVVELTNAKQAVMHYFDNPKLRTCLKELAEAEARMKGFDATKDRIPGFEIRVEKRAV